MLSAIYNFSFVADVRRDYLLWTTPGRALRTAAQRLAISAFIAVALGVPAGCDRRAAGRCWRHLSPDFAHPAITILRSVSSSSVSVKLEDRTHCRGHLAGLVPLSRADGHRNPAGADRQAQTFGRLPWQLGVRVVLPQICKADHLHQAEPRPAWIFLISRGAQRRAASATGFSCAPLPGDGCILPYVEWITLIAFALDGSYLYSKAAMPGRISKAAPLSVVEVQASG